MKQVLKKIKPWEIAKLSFFFLTVGGTFLIFALTPTLFPSALISGILFFVFSPIIDAFERKGIARKHGIFSVFMVCGLFLFFALTWITPHLSNELDTFQKEGSRYSGKFTERLLNQEKKLIDTYPSFKEIHLTEKAINWISQSAEKFWSIAPNFASQFLICLLLVPFLTYILLNDAHEIRRSILKLVPNQFFETAYGLTARMLDEMGGYVSARILEAMIMMGIVGISGLVLDIPFALLLGFFAGATNPIPYLGPLIGAAPGILMALLDPAHSNQLLFISLIYLIANLIDMLVVFPLVVAKIVAMHPVVVVLSVLLGSQIFGIAGMIIAVPIASILKILIQEIYARIYDHSTDESEAPREVHSIF